jgi:hypothetical protein
VTAVSGLAFSNQASYEVAPPFPRSWREGGLSRRARHAFVVASAGCRVGPFLARLLREKWGFFRPSISSSPRLDPNLFLPPSPVVDPNQPTIPIRVIPVAAPPPLVGLLHHSTDHWIPVHVFHFLHFLPIAPYIEVIKAALPELRYLWLCANVG